MNYPTLWRLIGAIKPDEVYHLAAQSQVGLSFEDDFGTLSTNIDGTHHLLSAIKELSSAMQIIFSGTSEMFGCALTEPRKTNRRRSIRSLRTGSPK